MRCLSLSLFLSLPPYIQYAFRIMTDQTASPSAAQVSDLFLQHLFHVGPEPFLRLASHDTAMAMEWWVPILKGPRLMLDDFYWFLGGFQAPGPDIRLPACYTKFQLAIAKKPKQIRDASPNLWAPGTAGTPASKAWTQTTGLLLALRRRSMGNT